MTTLERCPHCHEYKGWNRKECQLCGYQMNHQINHAAIRDFPTAAQLQRAEPLFFRIYVPSTRDKNKRISTTAFKKRIIETGKFITTMFPGATITTGEGVYRFGKKTIEERVAMISVHTDTTAYNRNDIRIREFLKTKKQGWGQDTMGFEYGNKFILV